MLFADIVWKDGIVALRMWLEVVLFEELDFKTCAGLHCSGWSLRLSLIEGGKLWLLGIMSVKTQR